MNDPDHSPLGRATRYAAHYDPHLLYPIPRAANRTGIGLGAVLPFVGCDTWNAWELSWLDLRGKPHIAIARFVFDAASPNIIESKSLKLYLNSFAATRLSAADELIARLERDLAAASGHAVAVSLTAPDAFAAERIVEPAGESIDEQEITIDDYGPPRAEQLAAGSDEVEENLYSRLLKSNCPVTGQPDWGSVRIHYHGPRLDRAALLRYIVSFREHNEFHEQCVERIYVDLWRRFQPRELDVYARYTRRGGLDINPWRSATHAAPPDNCREARQ